MAEVMLAKLASVVRVRPRHGPLLVPEAVPVYALLALTGVGTTALFAWRSLRLVGPEWPTVAVLLCLAAAVAWALRERGFARVATAIEAWALWTATCVTIVLATYAVGAGAMPLADPALAAADGYLLPEFDWPAAMRALAARPWLMAVANTSYDSIHWQPGLVLIASIVAGRPARCWTFVLAWTVTLVIVVAVFAVTPGLGAYAHYGIVADAVPAVRNVTPWTQPAILVALRDGTLRAIGFDDLKGIVTFPSFHAAAAILLAWAAWPVRALRWPMASLNAIMLLSAVPIGGHYVVDLLAGIVAAMAGIAIARRVEARSSGITSGLTAPSRERRNGLGVRRR